MNPLTTCQLAKMIETLAQSPTASTPANDNAAPPSSFGLSSITGGGHRRRLTLADLQDLLSHISSDVPRGNGSIITPDGAASPDYWFGCILAIRREFEEEGKAAAKIWSQESQRYTEEGFEKAWSDLDPQHPNPTTIASVIKLAKFQGWSRNAPARLPTLPAADLTHYTLLGREEILALPRPEWRVKSLLPTRGIGAMYGPSGSGKSFLVMDLAIKIASGAEWFGYRTRSCPVTYIMLEGQGALPNRVAALEKQLNAHIPDGLKVIVDPVNLDSAQDLGALAAMLPKGGLVIIDTLNRAAPGKDENSSLDMGLLIAGMKQIEEATKGFVMVVHHTGKEAGKGLRGHSSLNAALDGAIEVVKSGSIRSWRATKVKDGADGETHPFDLQVKVLGHDEDGDEIKSCVIQPGTGLIPIKVPPSGKVQKAALDVLNREISTSTTSGIGGCDLNTLCLKFDDGVEAVARSLTAAASNRRRHRARMQVTKLVEARHVHAGPDDNDKIWIWKI